LLGLQLQILERGIGGQDVKSVIEDLAHLLELFRGVKFDVEF
jgi:hypothetical protein